MGFGGISIWQLLIVLVIVLLLFGTKRIRNIGGDLGSAIKNFKKSVSDGSAEADAKAAEGEKLENAAEAKKGETIEGEVTSREKDKA